MKVIVTDEALLNFELVIDYLLLYAGNRVADKISDDIWEGIDLLSRSPYLGQVELSLEYYHLSHRRWVVGNYKIVCKIEREAIFVTDIFDTRQNPNKMRP